MSSLKENFGSRLKEIRRSRGLTQDKLAEMIDMDTPNLCKMENGNHFPQPKNLEKIAKALNVEVKELFDYQHLRSNGVLIKKISECLKTLKPKELAFTYKFINSLKEFR